MAMSTVNESQRIAARVVGFTYLFGFLGVFDAFYVRPHLIVDDAAETARNIIAHERLFRLGIATDLLTFASIAVLLTALYVVLKPVNRGLALVAAFWRLLEASTCVVMTLTSLDVLRLLSRAAYLRAFEPDHLQAWTMLSIGAHGDGYNVGEIFLGLGSTVFSYLWFKSRYIPRALAAWGLFSSALLATCTLAFVIFPNLADTLEPGCYVPIAIFELAMGFWLTIKGLRASGVAEPSKTNG